MQLNGKLELMTTDLVVHKLFSTQFQGGVHHHSNQRMDINQGISLWLCLKWSIVLTLQYKLYTSYHLKKSSMENSLWYVMKHFKQ